MEDSASMDENVDITKKKSVRSKKDAKVRRKIHKAEREKLKRDHMNELFLDLTKALEPATQNSGKASALTDTIRVLRDLIAQVDCLKKENSVLLAESQYVAVEKKELIEENSAMEAQIKRLQNQIDERARSQSFWSPECNPVVLQAVTDGATQTATPILGPVYVMPLQNDPKQLGSNVSKPHARYPSPSDSWPLKILAEQPKAD